jgi:hypothetical protein
LVISPYSKPGVDDQYYTQINMVRTIEQILGIKPMNQEDGSAEPMYSAFTSRPNVAPFNLTPNIIPLTLGAPGYPSTFTPSSTTATIAGSKVPLSSEGVIPVDMKSVYASWMSWMATQDARGKFSRPDRVNPEQLNRFDWYSAHNWKVAYPGDSKIYLPGQVPGRNLPAALIGN